MNTRDTPVRTIAGAALPGDDLMSAAEFKMVREYLGLTVDWVADRLDVTDRTVRNWEAGKYLIPEGVRLQLEAWEGDTAAAVSAVVTDALDSPGPVLLVSREDDPAGWPARWTRHVAARAAAQLPGVPIEYAEHSALSATSRDGEL